MNKALSPYCLAKGIPTMKKLSTRLAAAVTAAILMLIGFSGCVDDDPNNPVIMTAGNFQMHEFDFMLAFTSDEYYNYYTYGAWTPEEYFNRILNTATERAVALNYAKKNKIELSETELADIEKQLEASFAAIEEEYRGKVDEAITGEKEITEEAHRLIEKDLGYDIESYKKYIRTSMINSAVIEKIRDRLGDDIELTESDVKKHIADIMLKYKNTTSFTDFVDKYNDFLKGGSTEPYLVNEDCFTVGQLLLSFDEGGKDAAHTAEASIDADLNEGFTVESFYGLISEFGQDENMKKDRYIDWGYVVHDSLTPSYSNGFVYAAKNLIEDTDPARGEEMPELTIFINSKGERIVKFTSDDGIHYLILNRIFPKGEIKYEEGDDIWNIAYQAAFTREVDSAYSAALKEWMEKTKVTYYYDRFKDRYDVTPEEFNGLAAIG